ncbi:MAG: F420-nonreducing hydrogenase [Nanoarchaeota archaeon]
MSKPTALVIAFGGCNGCHVTITDLYERVTELFDLIDLKWGSVLTDFKYKDIPDVDVALIEGTIENEENLEILKKIREKSKILIALGTCSSYGGIPGLRNYYSVDECLDAAYLNNVSTVDGQIPYKEVPRMLTKALPVHKVVKVDYKITGCPPEPDQVLSAIKDLAQGNVPKIATKNLCEECHRKKKEIEPGNREFYTFTVESVMESDLDSEKCFLEQGVLCMGPATVAGCGGRCTAANMPCRGCYGPSEGAIEQGCEMANALAPIVPIGALIQKEDLPGTFYRFALPSSIIEGDMKKIANNLQPKGGEHNE